MKTNKLNEIVDNTAMYILLFVPFVILVIAEGTIRFINIFRKNKIKSLLED